MPRVNEHHLAVKGSYLFSDIAKRVKSFGEANPAARLIRLGIGDVTRPLAPAIVKAMQDKQLGVTYVVYPDEGHGFARPENRMSFNAVNEIFLAQCLGGSYQPIGDDFKGSTITVKAGAEQIHELPAAIAKK